MVIPSHIPSVQNLAAEARHWRQLAKEREPGWCMWRWEETGCSGSAGCLSRVSQGIGWATRCYLDFAPGPHPVIIRADYSRPAETAGFGLSR